MPYPRRQPVRCAATAVPLESAGAGMRVGHAAYPPCILPCSRSLGKSLDSRFPAKSGIGGFPDSRFPAKSGMGGTGIGDFRVCPAAQAEAEYPIQPAGFGAAKQAAPCDSRSGDLSGLVRLTQAAAELWPRGRHCFDQVHRMLAQLCPRGAC